MPGNPAPGQIAVGVNGADQFVAGLAQATGLDTNVIRTWVKVEGAYSPGGTGGYNYLNLRSRGSIGYSGVPILSTSSNGFAQFGSLDDAVKETAYWINSMPNYATIRSSTKLGAKSQLAAIAASPWDKNHYNGGRTLYDTYAAVSKAGANWLGKTGPTVSAAAKAVTDAANNVATKVVPGLGAAEQAAAAASTVVGLATNPQNWLRAGYILGGGIMVLLGAVLLAKSVGALNVSTPATPTLDLGGGKPGDGRGPIAGQSRTAQKAAGFSLNLPNQGRRPKAGAPGSTKLAKGDSIPF